MIKNSLLKLWYKFFNRSQYRNLKNEIRTAKNVKYYNAHIYNKILEIEKKIKDNRELSFLHSGQLGDLIYSLATIKELSKSHKCKLYIQINKPMPLDYKDSSKKSISATKPCIIKNSKKERSEKKINSQNV